MAKEIVMTIGKDGKISLEANGFSGDQCAKELAKFEKNMGAMTEIEEKPEYYDQTIEEDNSLWQE